jgi:hypothetical protein
MTCWLCVFFCLFKTIKIFLMYFFAVFLFKISPFFITKLRVYWWCLFLTLWITLIADQETFHAHRHKVITSFKIELDFASCPSIMFLSYAWASDLSMTFFYLLWLSLRTADVQFYKLGFSAWDSLSKFPNGKYPAQDFLNAKKKWVSRIV